MENNQQDQNDFTQQYNQLKEQENIQREDERNIRTERNRKGIFLKICIVFLVALLIFLFILKPIGKKLEDYRKENLVFNVMERFDYQFNGNFEVLSPEVDLTADVTPNTLYIIRDQNGIEFQVYKNGAQIFTDYDQYLYQNYVLDYIASTNADEITYEEKETEFCGSNFYVFQIKIIIPSYDKIDSIMENRIKDFIQYMEKRAKKDFGNEAIDFKMNYYLHDDVGELSYYEYTTYGLSYLTNKVKVKYINYLVENSLKDNTVSEEDIAQYHRPPELDLYVNGNVSTYEAFGNAYPYHAILLYDKMDYFVDINLIINYLNEINDKKYHFMDLHDFTYHNQKYTIIDTMGFEIKGNKVPIFWTTKMLEDFFDAKIVYDYENKTIDILNGENAK